MTTSTTQHLVSSVKHTLNNGVAMPMLGLGTLNMGDDQTLIKAIKFALSIGYRHFDCAWVYGNEKVIGRAFKEALEESKGTLKREDLFIVSKVWNTHHSRSKVRESCRDSCENLGVTYLDQLLIHWPTGFKEDTGSPFPNDERGKVIDSGVHYLETWKALEELQMEGKVRSIGVSNFNLEQLQDVLKNCKIRPAVLQIEINPYYQNEALVQFCHRNQICVTAYAPFGVGHKHPEKPELTPISDNQTLIRIGKKYGKTAAQVCIRWLLQRNIATIPKSVTPSRIFENSQVFDFTLTSDDMNEIRGLESNLKSDVYKAYVNTEIGKFDLTEHPFYPFRI